MKNKLKLKPRVSVSTVVGRSRVAGNRALTASTAVRGRRSGLGKEGLRAWLITYLIRCYVDTLTSLPREEGDERGAVLCRRARNSSTDSSGRRQFTGTGVVSVIGTVGGGAAGGKELPPS